MDGERLDSFMREPNIAVVSTVGPDGRVHQAPVWHLWDRQSSFFTGRRSRKWRNLLANPELSLCVDRNEPPYAYVVVQGTAAESGRSLHDAAFEMAAIYYGPERAARTAARYRDDDPSLVLVEITPRSVVAWEQGRPRARGTDAD